MKILTGVVLLALAVAYPVEFRAQGPQSRSSSVWRPAVYRGLTIGKSSGDDVKRILGTPERTVKGAGTRPPLVTYTVTDPLPGTLEVVISKGKLRHLMLDLKQPISKKEAIRIFGSDFRITRYKLDECINEGGEGPVYETQDGDIEQIEYRDRGIALDLYQGQVETVLYVDGPFGPKHSRCGQLGQTKEKKNGATNPK